MGKPAKRRNKPSSQNAGDASKTASSSNSDIDAVATSSSNDNDDTAASTTPSTTTSTWKTVRSHPTFLVTVFFIFPWLLSKQVNRIYLVYPHHVNSILEFFEDKVGIYYNTNHHDQGGYRRLRPFLPMEGKRQLLVVGSMSSGTSQVAHDLTERLGLEVGHEDTDTTHYAVRDGAVSWFHGLRYLDHPDANERIRTTIDICNVAWRIYSSDKMNFFNPWSNYGTELILFGPVKYDLPVFHPSFRTAYLKTCQATIFRELGCGIGIGGSTTTCQLAPFERTLLQTRQPWRIVTSLVTKYCGGGSTDAPQSLLLLFQALYPSQKEVWFPPESSGHDDSGEENDDDKLLAVCAEQMASYVYLWYNDLMDSFEALRQQEPDNFLVYHIEDTSICQVAGMAGFDVGDTSEFQSGKGGGSDNDAVVFRPNIDKVKSFCQENPTMPFGNTQNQFNSQNKNTEGDSSTKQEQKLDVKTVLGAVSTKTKKKIDELATRMGYQ